MLPDPFLTDQDVMQPRPSGTRGERPDRRVPIRAAVFQQKYFAHIVEPRAPQLAFAVAHDDLNVARQILMPVESWNVWLLRRPHSSLRLREKPFRFGGRRVRGSHAL
jgi:hypothetical protein